jgi:hypothetical protein
MIRTNDVAKLLSNLQGVKNGFEKKKESLQDVYDSRLQAWQESDKGEEMINNIASLQEIVSKLFEVCCNVEDLFEPKF